LVNPQFSSRDITDEEENRFFESSRNLWTLLKSEQTLKASGKMNERYFGGSVNAEASVVPSDRGQQPRMQIGTLVSSREKGDDCTECRRLFDIRPVVSEILR